ncbi:mitochondrial chaperone [Bulinus truncatus]|nr:mitochondrial chaperone [Bulinus truncatus]
MTVIDYLTALGDNPYFGAGAGLFGMGILAAAGRKGLQGAAIVFRRNLMITMEVTSRDKSYQWLLQWITKYGTKSQHLSVETEFQESAAGQVKTRFHFVPSPGSHYFWHNKNLIIVERNRDNKVMEVFETVTLTAFGRNRELFMNILSEARNLALLSNEGQTVMYSAVGPEWRTLGYPRRKRPLNSVILDKGVSERILDDIKGFISNSKWYIERGIPYRRGYLLYGPPGCGKSSYIMALAGAIDYSICVMNLSDKGMSDDRLTHLLTNAPEQSIILLEDIDAAFVSRDAAKEKQRQWRHLSNARTKTVAPSLKCQNKDSGAIFQMPEQRQWRHLSNARTKTVAPSFENAKAKTVAPSLKCQNKDSGAIFKCQNKDSGAIFQMPEQRQWRHLSNARTKTVAPPSNARTKTGAIFKMPEQRQWRHLSNARTKTVAPSFKCQNKDSGAIFHMPEQRQWRHLSNARTNTAAPSLKCQNKDSGAIFQMPEQRQWRHLSNARTKTVRHL